MPTNEDSLSQRVESAYQQLSAVASDLNVISDELGKTVGEIDAALKKLNLGISVWVEIGGWDDEETLSFFTERIGYAKVNDKWGVALSTVEGDHRNPERDTVEQWLFNDGPRKLRLSAIGSIPELLKRLSEEAVTTTNRIKAKLAEAKEVAAAVKNASEGPPKKRLSNTPVGAVITQGQPPVWPSGKGVQK